MTTQARRQLALLEEFLQVQREITRLLHVQETLLADLESLDSQDKVCQTRQKKGVPPS